MVLGLREVAHLAAEFAGHPVPRLDAPGQHVIRLVHRGARTTTPAHALHAVEVVEGSTRQTLLLQGSLEPSRWSRLWDPLDGQLDVDDADHPARRAPDGERKRR